MIFVLTRFFLVMGVVFTCIHKSNINGFSLALTTEALQVSFCPTHAKKIKKTAKHLVC